MQLVLRPPYPIWVDSCLTLLGAEVGKAAIQVADALRLQRAPISVVPAQPLVDETGRGHVPLRFRGVDTSRATRGC